MTVSGTCQALARFFSMTASLCTVLIFLALLLALSWRLTLLALLGAASFAVVPSFVYYSKTANLEAPYLLWFAVSTHFYLKILRRQRLRDYLLFGVLAGAAVAEVQRHVAGREAPRITLLLIASMSMAKWKAWRTRTSLKVSSPVGDRWIPIFWPRSVTSTPARPFRWDSTF